MNAVNAISLFLSVVAILLSLGSFYYARRQTNLMEKDQSKRQFEDESVLKWSEKFDEAVRDVLKIEPRTFESSGLGSAYGFIFPEQALRQQIESYLVDSSPGHRHFSVRQASGEQLLMPIVQQTIQEVLDRVGKFRTTHPTQAAQIDL